MSIKNDKGSALVMVMGFTLVLTILGTAMLGVAINEYMMEKAHRNGVKAYYLAEAGLEKAIYEITDMEDIDPGDLLDTTWEMESDERDLLDDGVDGDFSAKVDSIILVDTIYVDEEETQVYKYIYEIVLTAEGEVDRAKKRIEATVEAEDYVPEDLENKVKIVHWRQTD